MSVSTMAVTVELGAAIPNTSAAVPSLKNGNSNFANNSSSYWDYYSL